MDLDLIGKPHRLYVEEAGQGAPLLCLHTAGSDGRQYRALMNEKRITSRFRVIAFDMPWHGKSSPPAGWHNEEYQLTSAQYTTMVLSVMTALELDRPVLIGCKIDGDIRSRVADIDTGRCPLFLLSGEYDYSCTPEETLGVATRIPGCEATIMKGLGHFPMSENPGEFLKYLLPVLERIAATSADAAV